MYLNYNYYTVNYTNQRNELVSIVDTFYFHQRNFTGWDIFYPFQISAPQKIVVICTWQPIHVIKSLSINRSLQEGLKLTKRPLMKLFSSFSMNIFGRNTAAVYLDNMN